MPDWYNLETADVFEKLKSSPAGLGSAEAQKRFHQNGPNILVQKKPKNGFHIFFRQFTNFLILLLIVAFGISLFTEQLSHSLVLLVVILLNVIMGFVLEFRAEKALESLKKIFTYRTLVIRNGKEKIIPIDKLVTGDVVVLRQGDRAPADLRLFEENKLMINESALTGESVASSKNIKKFETKKPISEQENMVFAGTIAVSGAGQGIVTATASNTEMGKIASQIQREEGKTPLQKRLDYLGKILALFSFGLVAVIFLLGLIRGMPILSLFNYSVALFVSAVPESLPTIVTLALAIGVIMMAKNKAIIRKMPAVETLASINIICADKTGTLTKNEMTVKKIWLPNSGEIDVKGEGYKPEPQFSPKDENLKKLIIAGYLANSSSLNFHQKHEAWEIIGDPTEGSLKVLGEKANIDHILHDHQKIHEILFDDKRMMMSVVYEFEGKNYVYTKGAPEKVMQVCGLNKNQKIELKAKTEGLAAEGYRVLALAYKELPNHHFSDGQVESDLKFLGLVGLIDPPAEGVKEAIENCRKAQIKTVMISGDHQLTATSIAKKLGFKVGAESILTGEDLEKMSDEEISKKIDDIQVFARVSPIQKSKILASYKHKGYLVAMTGDGINDAPALKEAEIGIAMGERGQDVAKEASDIILTDDSYLTIEKAVIFGRTIYDNIQKFITLLLSANFEELVLVSIAFLLSWPQPFTVLQILWINLITDSFPALALAFEPPSPEIMNEPPKNPKKSILKPIFWYAFGVSMLALVGEIILFLFYLKNADLALARTMVFTFIVIFELFLVFSIRSKKPFWQSRPFANKFLWIAVFISVGFQLIALYSPLAKPMGTHPLNLIEWIIILAISLFCFLLLEMIKLLKSDKIENRD